MFRAARAARLSKAVFGRAAEADERGQSVVVREAPRGDVGPVRVPRHRVVLVDDGHHPDVHDGREALLEVLLARRVVEVALRHEELRRLDVLRREERLVERHERELARGGAPAEASPRRDRRPRVPAEASARHPRRCRDPRADCRRRSGYARGRVALASNVLGALQLVPERPVQRGLLPQSRPAAADRARRHEDDLGAVAHQPRGRLDDAAQAPAFGVEIFSPGRGGAARDAARFASAAPAARVSDGEPSSFETVDVPALMTTNRECFRHSRTIWPARELLRDFSLASTAR